MPTPDMSDDELDALFRRGAEAYPEEPPPLGAWARMDDKLQAATVASLVRRKVMRLFALEVAIILTALLGWQSYRKFAPHTAPDSVTVALSATDKKPSTHTSSSSPDAPNGTLEATAARVSSGVAINAPSMSSANTVASRRKETDRLREETTGARSGSQPVAAWLLPPKPGRQQNAPQPELGAVGLAGGHFVSAASSIQPEKAPQVVPIPEQQLTSQIAPADSVSQSIVTAPDTIQLAPAVALTDSIEKPTLGAMLPVYRWSLGLVGGPSASGVRAREGTRLGGELGVSVDYRFTPRLRVRTGLVRSVKRYAARGSDYYPPYGYWQAGSPILALDANCRITEVPLDLRYDVVVRPTYSLFLNAGLTTLLMRNERYAYQYEKDGALTSATWSLARGSNHAFGMLNLSGGVERAVGGRWSVQAEPFLKLPLGGVGFGHIKLRSAGVAFSVKYGLLGRVSP